MGYRQPRVDDPALKVLMEECTDLRVKISLLADSEDPDRGRLQALRARLFDLEKLVSEHSAIDHKQPVRRPKRRPEAHEADI